MDDLEANRTSLTSPIEFDHGLESLWIRIKEVQRIAIGGGQPISNGAAIALTLPLFDAAGTFTSDCYEWRKKPTTAQSDMLEFQRLFNLANKERMRQLTAKSAGFHGAHHTAGTPRLPPDQHAANTAEGSTGAKAKPASHKAAVVDGTNWFYCHTHGLGPNPKHTSATCKNPAEGHEKTATINNMMGGCNLIFPARGRYSTRNRGKPSPAPK
jgi:hypothetical protein